MRFPCLGNNPIVDPVITQAWQKIMQTSCRKYIGCKGAIGHILISSSVVGCTDRQWGHEDCKKMSVMPCQMLTEGL